MRNRRLKSIALSVGLSIFMSGCVINEMYVKMGTSSESNEYALQKKEYASDKPLVLFIFDTSGSMEEREGYDSKLNKAKKSITDTINQIDKSRFNVSLITFGGTFLSLLGNSCDANLKIAPSGNFSEVIQTIQGINAQGATPLAKSIALSNEVVEKIDKKMVILLSDGEETCGGNPVAEAKKLYKKYGIKLDLHVIGYGVNGATKRKLEAITNVGKHWKYHNAQDTVALNQAIDSILSENSMRDNSVWVDGQHFAFEFSSGSTLLSDEYLMKIQKMYDYLSKNSKHIIVVGHTDSVGSAESNMKLSIKRANMVRNQLITFGIEGNRIEAMGDGENSPIASNDTEEGRRENRRVEIEILD